MTASALEGDKEKAIDSGMNDYVTKPVDIPMLLDVLASWLIPNRRGDEGSKYTSIAVDGATSVLSTTEGIRNCNGNSQLYLKLLSKFVDSIDERLENMRASVKDDDLQRLQREAHTLKGISQNIGAKRIASFAKTVEMLWRESASLMELELLLTESENLVRETVSIVEAYLTTHCPTAPKGNDATSLSHSELNDRLKKVLAAILVNDATAIDLLNEVAKDGRLADLDVDVLVDKLNDYEFDDAKVIIETMISSFEESYLH